jgi:iron complex transport system substrate-binding protein
VLFVVQHAPLRVAGGPSHVTELLVAVGAANVAAGMDRPWPELSAETLVAWNPDVILDASFAPEAGDADVLGFWERFTSLSAVRGGRVHRMNEPAVVRPGPRLPEALDYLSRTVWEEGR